MKPNTNEGKQNHKPSCCRDNMDAVAAAKEKSLHASDLHVTHMMLHITGMRCGACAEKVRDTLNKVEGVLNVAVSLAGATANIRYDSLRTDFKAITSVLAAAGYSTQHHDAVGPSQRPALPDGWLKWRLIWAVSAGLGVIGFYLGLITLTSDWSNAAYQFEEYGGWIIALALGLGVQVGLFSHMRAVMAGARLKGAAKGMAASGGMSGVAMALCCSHYLAALLPLIGLPFFSGAVAGLVEYQTVFFVIGAVSNVIGIAYMLHLLAKNGMMASRTVFS